MFRPHTENELKELADDFLSQCPMDRLPRKLKDLTTLKQVPDTDFYEKLSKNNLHYKSSGQRRKPSRS